MSPFDPDYKPTVAEELAKKAGSKFRRKPNQAQKAWNKPEKKKRSKK